MPRPKRPEYDSKQFSDLWHSTTTSKEMAEIYNVSPVAIFKAAQARGFQSKRVVLHRIRSHE